MMGLRSALVAFIENPTLNGLSVEMPGFFLLLLALPAFLFVSWRPLMATYAYSRGELAAQMPRGGGHLARAVGVLCRTLALAIVIVCLVGPTVPGEPDPEAEEGIDIVVVLDVSGSMRAVDFKPRGRLTVAKRVIRDHLLTREGDRIGLVIFAGEAFTQAPLTRDRRLLEEILRGVRTGVIIDGTAIGDAVATGVNRLRDSEAKGRALILVTDGENNAGNLSPEEAARLAKEFDIKIFPILVGRGGQVPFPTAGGMGSTTYVYRQVNINPRLLRTMARVADGQFFTAENPEALETSFQSILEKLEKSKLDDGPVLRRPIPLYPLLLPVAILFFALGQLLLMTRGAVMP